MRDDELRLTEVTLPRREDSVTVASAGTWNVS
jgi:hypothetical protein